MNNKAYIQFSKRLAVAICVFWMVFRTLVLASILIKTEVSEHAIRLINGVDDVMIVSVGFYTGNSVIEKGIIGYFSAKGATRYDDIDMENG